METIQDQVTNAATVEDRAATSQTGTSAATEERGGFLEWVTRLVHTHRGRLCQLAKREGLLDEDSLDCVQDAFHTFLLLPQARRLVESSDDSIKLLSVLVRNHARNPRRQHASARTHVSADETLAVIDSDATPVDEVIDQAQSFALMVGCIEHLGKLQRAVVSLRLLDEARGEDVAAMLGVSRSHVAVLLHRAKEN